MNLANYDQFGIGLWAIENRSAAIFVGDCGLTYQTVENDRFLEVGYHLQRRHRGHGYALESARSCVDFALGTLRAPTVCSIVDPQTTRRFESLKKSTTRCEPSSTTKGTIGTCWSSPAL